MNEAREAEFARHRGLVFTIAYDLTGSVDDAEDVAHDVFERWVAIDEEIVDARAYLARMATNRALDTVTSASRTRVDYVGPWLPEPLRTAGGAELPTAAAVEAGDPGDRAVRRDAVSAALLVVLQSLGERERAVFVLHDVFGFEFGEIAAMLETSEASARQTGHRARSHVRARRERFHVDRREHADVVARFLAAAESGDLDALLDTLAPDATLTSDGGGKASAATRPVRGADRVARFIAGLVRQYGDEERVETAELGGALGLVTWRGEVITSTFQFVIDAGRIHDLYVMRNPDKLQRL